jgi:TP901 family phage tail tape measure protein
MAEIKEVTIKVNVETGEIVKGKKAFDKLNKSAKGVKTATDAAKDSMANFKKQLLGVGAGLAGLAAVKAVITDAAKRIVDFEKSISSLSAITGAVGADLDKLKGNVLQVAKDTKKSAIDIAKAFELVGSAQPQLLQNADALALVTKNAVTLSKASGLELTQAVAATTTGLAQFNIAAEDSQIVIDSLAAGAKFGASAIPETTAAIEKFGAVAAGANVTIQDSVSLVETLATKQLTGAEAGNNLKNIILKLQNAGKGFVDGQFDINAALEQTKAEFDAIQDPVKRSQAQTKLFGLESATAGAILLENIDTFEDFQGKVGEVGVAMEQANIQTDNLSTKTEELDATYESFILSLEDGTGALSEFAKGMVDAATNTLSFLTNLNDGKGIVSSFNELIADQTQSTGLLEEQSKALGISQKNLSLAFQNNEGVLIALGEKFKNGEITLEQYRLLVNKLALGTEELTTETEVETAALDDNTEATDKNTESKKKQLDFFDKLALKIKETKEAIEKEDILGTIFDDSFDEEEDPAFLKAVGLDDEGLEKMKEGQEKKRELVAENASLELEEDLLRQEAQLEQDQLFAQAKQDINEQLGFSALALAGAIASAAGDSQAAQAAALAFDKIAAIASIIINTQRANALISATIPAPASLPLIAKNNISGALGVATVVATAIPQAKAITESKKLKDGEIRIQGAGTTTSDSIPAMLSREESVINAKSSIKHEGALKAINDDRFDDYLNKVLIKQLYMGKVKENKASKKALQNSINFPKAFRMSNAKEISKDIAKVMDEHNFLNQNGKWE